MKILVAAAVASVAIAGVGTAGYLSSVESARVNITLPAWKLESWATVHGAPTKGEFQTQRDQVTLTDSATGTATGAVSTGGSYATGYVVLNHNCPAYPGCTVLPALPGYTVCRGPVYPNPPQTLNICYVLQGTASCLCGESVPIRADGPGSSSNMPANSINVTGWNEPSGVSIYVNNPSPISGGTDPVSRPVVKQSDIDAASASARAQLSIDLQSALLLKGGGLTHLIPDGAPKMTVTSSVAAGARTKTFEVTATGTLGATEFRDSDAAGLIAKGIDRWVPNGFRLNGAPVVVQYQVDNSNEHGDVTISGEALDYVVPNFAIDALRARLRGVSADAARRMIETAAPGSHVDIRLSPASAPMLPINGARIYISIAVRAAA